VCPGEGRQRRGRGSGNGRIGLDHVIDIALAVDLVDYGYDEITQYRFDGAI
jgi:hypothetical protein